MPSLLAEGDKGWSVEGLSQEEEERSGEEIRVANLVITFVTTTELDDETSDEKFSNHGEFGVDNRDE